MIGDSYEYLITSLPSLNFKEFPRLTSDELINRASSDLSENNFAKFQQVDLWKLEFAPVSGITTIMEFYAELKAEIVNLRQSKASNFAFGVSILPSEFASLNPLQAELAIHLILWEKLEEIVSGHDFDFTEVLVYKLKLQLLERQYSFDDTIGMNKVKEIILSQKRKEEESWH